MIPSAMVLLSGRARNSQLDHRVGHRLEQKQCVIVSHSVSCIIKDSQLDLLAGSSKQQQLGRCAVGGSTENCPSPSAPPATPPMHARRRDEGWTYDVVTRAKSRTRACVAIGTTTPSPAPCARFPLPFSSLSLSTSRAKRAGRHRCRL